MSCAILCKVINRPRSRRDRSTAGDGVSQKVPSLSDLTITDAFTTALEHHRSGRHGAAEVLCRQIIAAEPQHADALHLLGVLAHQSGHHQSATQLIGRAIALNDGVARYHLSLGEALRAMKQTAEAMQCFRRAIDRNPNLAAAYYSLATLQFDSDDFPAAADNFRSALAHAPNMLRAQVGLGNALFQMGDPEAAVDCYRAVLQRDPEYAGCHSNLGLALQDIGLLDEAIAHGERAIALRPNFAAAHNNLSLALMLKGDFAAGLPHHEWRLRVDEAQGAKQRFEQPVWCGQPLDGRRILIHAEQGAGDVLQFLRYVPLLAERGGRVLVEVQPELKRLAMSLKGAEAVIGRGEPLPAFDEHCPVLSLMLAFGTTVTNVPDAVPYLAAPEPLRDEWRARLAATPGLRVGLIWGGRPEQRRDRYRSIALSALAPLAIPGVTFFSLQKGPAAAQADNPPPGMTLHNLGDALSDFADTAAAMSALDLIITVDTSTAHLAGAIGKPVWILLSQPPDWRWLLDREDSPWYPTARLFRQPAHRVWGPAVAQVAAELQRHLAGVAA